MSNIHPHIPTLDVSGAPGQIGAAHGESQRDRIREYVDRFLGWVVSSTAVHVTEADMWARWSAQVAANQREAADLVEEMRGIARGAGVPFERIFMLNSLLDLNCFRYLEMAASFAGCSTYAIVKEAGTGKTIVGQTYDMPELHEDYLTILRIKPSQGPRQLVFTFAGIVGAAGLNDAGLAVNINFLSALDVGLGRLHSVVVRQILAQTNLSDALTYPAAPPRAGGAHFLIGDTDGNVISVETTAKRFAIAYPQGNAIGHTNHYLVPELRNTEHIRANSIGSSLARYTALRRFLHDHGERLTTQSLMDLSRNHTSYPRSICAHGAHTEPAGNKGKTVSAMILDPADGLMHITKGCACEGEYHAVKL